MTTLTRQQERVLDYLIRSGHASTGAVSRMLYGKPLPCGRAEGILLRMADAGLVVQRIERGGAFAVQRWVPTVEVLEADEESYASVTDELNDYDAVLTLADLDGDTVARAERYAATHGLNWPPSTGDYDRLYERRAIDARRARVES